MNVQMKQKRDYIDYITLSESAERGMKNWTGREDSISEGMRVGLRDEYKLISFFPLISLPFFGSNLYFLQHISSSRRWLANALYVYMHIFDQATAAFCF